MDNNNNVDDYAFCRVPQHARANFISVTLVLLGAATSLSQFMLAATLGFGMTYWQAMLSTIIGSLILQFLSLGLGYAGMREGLTTSLLSRWCGFGRIGSLLIGILISLTLIGWFGVQNSVLAEGLLYSLDHKISFTSAAAICGLVLTGLVAFGFKALSLTAKISVPLFVIVISWIIYNTLKNNNIYELFFSLPAGPPITLAEGIAFICGGYILGALIMPDLSRYCQNGKHVFWMISLAIVVGEVIINSITILIAHALGTADVVSILTQSAGIIGLLSAILSAVKVNDTNLYSSSLAMANVLEGLWKFKPSYKKLTIVLGIIGTSLSVIGIMNYFIQFLTLLGVVFPPILSVILTDYYILRTSRTLLDSTRSKGEIPNDNATPLICWTAIIACVLGSTVGITLEFGIASLNSIFSAGVFYWFIMKYKINEIFLSLFYKFVK